LLNSDLDYLLASQSGESRRTVVADEFMTKAIVGECGLAHRLPGGEREHKIMAGAALNVGVTPVQLKELRALPELRKQVRLAFG
jgi:hypothetical protein